MIAGAQQGEEDSRRLLPFRRARGRARQARREIPRGVERSFACCAPARRRRSRCSRANSPAPARSPLRRQSRARQHPRQRAVAPHPVMHQRGAGMDCGKDQQRIGERIRAATECCAPDCGRPARATGRARMPKIGSALPRLSCTMMPRSGTASSRAYSVKWLALPASSISRPSGVASGGGGGLTLRHSQPDEHQRQHALAERHVHEKTEVARRPLRQHVAELAKQQAANDKDRGEPVQSLRTGAVARC